MMLMHQLFSSPIKFLENTTNVLVIENPLIFNKTIRELLQQKNGFDGKFILSENYTPIPINKNMEIITDTFTLNLDSKKITTKIHSLLKDISNIDLIQETQVLQKELNLYLSNLIQFCDYPLKYEQNIDIASIFKACNLSIDISYETPLEQIINYILLFRNLFNTKLFVFVNLKCILSKDEFINLYKTINYEKINILLIENTPKDIITPYEKIRIIDNDICEIY